jgi:hypothetical protein
MGIHTVPITQLYIVIDIHLSALARPCTYICTVLYGSRVKNRFFGWVARSNTIDIHGRWHEQGTWSIVLSRLVMLISFFIHTDQTDIFLCLCWQSWFPLLWLLTLLSLFLEFLADLAFLGHSSCSCSVSFMQFSMSWFISNMSALIRKAQTMPEYSRTEFRVRQSKYHAIDNRMQAEPWWCQSPKDARV